MAWVGKFQKDEKRPTASNVGLATAEWWDNDVLICSYSEPVDGVQDKDAFKANAIAYRDKYIADKAKDETIETALTNFLNQ